MLEKVCQGHCPIRTALFHRPAQRRRVNRDQTVFQAKPHHKISGAEVPLNEHIIAFLRIGGQPVSNRLQILLQAIRPGRHLTPYLLNCGTRFNTAPHSQSGARLVKLLLRQSVIEKHQQGYFSFGRRIALHIFHDRRPQSASFKIFFILATFSNCFFEHCFFVQRFSPIHRFLKSAAARFCMPGSSISS